MTTTKTKRRIKTKVRPDKFAKDRIGGEYEKPGQTVDSDAGWIAAQLSKLVGRATTGFVLRYCPSWIKRAGLRPFDFYFFDDKLVVDSFGRDRREIDALEDDLTQAQKEEIAHKTLLCSENGVAYIHIGPDDELDVVTLAAKIGKTKFKKGDRPARSRSEDGISDEEA